MGWNFPEVHFIGSFSANWPGPDNIALMVPDVRACSLFTMNSWLSWEMSLTYMASGPSQPPYTRSSLPSSLIVKIHWRTA